MSAEVVVLLSMVLAAPGIAQQKSRDTVVVDKPAIDINVLGKWPYVDGARTSPDGLYAAYFIHRPPESTTLVITQTDGTWTRQFADVDAFSPYSFSADNKQLIFQRGDTLQFVLLGTPQVISIAGVNSFQSSPSDGAEWLAYQLNNAARELVLRNLVTGNERRFPSVSEYLLDDGGNVLLVKTESSPDGAHRFALQWIPLRRGAPVTIWSSGASSADSLTAHSFVFDAQGAQLSFIAEDKLGDRAIWYYRAGMKNAVKKVHSRASGMSSRFAVAGEPQFSKNGRWIFFSLRSTEQPTPRADAAKVAVWGYKDVVLQPEQMRRTREGAPRFAAVVSAEDSNVVRLEMDGENVRNIPQEITGDYVVVADQEDVPYWWQFGPQSSFFLVSLHDGSRKLLRQEAGRYTLSHFSFSPHGKYLVYWDADRRNFFSYDIASGTTRNVTKGIKTEISKPSIYRLDEAALRPIAPVAGWHVDDSSLLIYDWYDIWELDPSAVKAPFNVTNGYGRRERIQFRLVYGPGQLGEGSAVDFDRNEPQLITAFSPVTKYNGFYQITPRAKGDPQQLIMGPYTWYRTESQKPHFASFGNGMRPLKARDANRWIVKRHTATEAPNYFATRDFKTYRALSQLAPHSNYNWLTSELISWQLPDGTMSQGVLYKPENFDATRKYPVIFNYYRQLSHRLYEFPYPHFTGENINIPWFVSKGYLVFTPDIHYSISEKLVGESAYNSIVSAAQFLSTLPFVDAKRMGLQGHSFGGYETNYLITRTGIFAAAAEFAGTTDNLSSFLTLAPFLSDIEHYDKLSRTELTIGATPWERPELYSAASPVLNAHKVTTPLLITHNARDNQIPWRQGIELYMALRRLGKKVWMLQYDDGIHVLFGKDARDYTLRLTQFFDHYLKDAPPPKWMTEGVPARLKGSESGLELDTMGKVP